MVRNYKWNIEKKKVLDVAKENISEIIKETNSNCIEMNELVTLLNSRTHFLNLKNVGSHRTMTNFLKSNCKGTLNFIESLNESPSTYMSSVRLVLSVDPKFPWPPSLPTDNLTVIAVGIVTVPVVST